MSRLRLGMIGGGAGAFIGSVHRSAAAMDGHWTLVAGCFSRDASTCAQTGADLGLAPERVNADWREWIKAEAARGDDRLHAVAIVTPNNVHAPQAIACFEAGFDVVCEKPLAISVAECREIEAVMQRTGRRMALAHTYAGYPLVQQAKRLVAQGEVGDIRRIDVVYRQGWLSEPIEREGQRQAAWRCDPAQSGPGGCLGDIGTHAAHLAAFITGQQLEEVAADIRAAVPGRQLDDDISVLMRFDGGARGTLASSQVCAGMENGLQILIGGSKATLIWGQENPNRLEIIRPNGDRRIMTPGWNRPGEATTCRVPAGHPEGYLEAFANIYWNFAETIKGNGPDFVMPDIEDGIRGLQFVEACVASSAENGRWMPLD